MRKFLLFLSVASLGLNLTAQQALRDNKLDRMLQDKTVVNTNAANTSSSTHNHKSSRGGGLTSILNSQRVGSAGNLLTIIDGGNNQLDVNNDLNTVVFIHRNDPSIAPGTNVAQYRYDISKTRGATWTTNIGPITNDLSIDNVNVNGRFPEGGIFNPSGNTVADSAYLIYSGTWHDGSAGSWQGSMRGRGKLSGDTSTFNVNIDVVNTGNVAIGTGFCQSTPGTFWKVNESSNNSFAQGSNSITDGIVVEKGVWNNTTKDIDWTESKVSQVFEDLDNAGSTISTATSFSIAFDPTGQYGWIAGLGDITNDGDSVYDPLFWKSTDFGATWSSVIRVDLDSVQGVFDELNSELVDGTPLDKKPTCSFDCDLVVDANGNPHLLVIVGNGTEYSILAAGYDVWDITYDPSAQAGCNWKGIHFADIWTLRGTFSSDNPAQTEDNRPLTARSADGNKLFFFWLESDRDVILSTDNDIPNLFGRGIDIANETITPLYNFTEGDSLWGGETVNSSGGVFGGAVYPAISPIVWENGSNYNIPLILTQVDYNHDPSLGLGSSEQPAAFYYIDNLNIPNNAFTLPLDQTPPSITLNGQDTVTVLVNTTYTEDGATAFDCTDGAITPTIQNSPNPNVVGVYDVLYIATDAAGNSDTVVRTVIVGAIPTANFSWSFPQLAYKAQFQDQSINLPQSWQWNFGDGTGSIAQNPLKTFTTNGNFNVCLTVSNAFGTSQQVCKQVSTSGVGINDVDFSSSISMFPNPSTGKVQLTFNGNVTPDMNVTVYNILGEAVLPTTFFKAGTTNMELNMLSASNGLYLVKIQSDNGTAVKHLTIQHK